MQFFHSSKLCERKKKCFYVAGCKDIRYRLHKVDLMPGLIALSR